MGREVPRTWYFIRNHWVHAISSCDSPTQDLVALFQIFPIPESTPLRRRATGASTSVADYYAGGKQPATTQREDTGPTPRPDREFRDGWLTDVAFRYPGFFNTVWMPGFCNTVWIIYTMYVKRNLPRQTNCSPLGGLPGRRGSQGWGGGSVI